MKQKNQRNQKRKLNSLVLLVAFTAIMLIVSTYAWFSINTEVRLTNLTGEVKVVEGLQISLDATSWTDTIDLTNVTLTDEAKTYEGNINKHPTELKPVSTTGTVGADMSDLTMYTGTHNGKTELKTITAATDGYFAFDVFIMNSSKTDAADTLQLNTDTLFKLVDSAKETSGLQNTVRVGIAKYGTTAALTADQDGVLGATKTAKISDVAIWEPNANAHIDGIVGNNNKLTLSSSDISTWMGSPVEGVETVDSDSGKVKFGPARILPTYALTSAAVGKTIDDIYDWSDVATDGYLGMQKTLQTNNTSAALGKVYNLKSTTNPVSESDSNPANFTIDANAITRLRVFLWLEGQDVDCTNYASHGGKLTLSLGFCKGKTENLGNN